MSDYRKLYEQVYGVIIPNDFEIHHIDFNHSNNNPANLIMLPKELHKQLHMAYNDFCEAKQDYTLDDITIFSGHTDSKSHFMFCLIEYIEVLNECVLWMNHRDFAKLNKGGNLI